jgi:hypothetical protein
MRGSEYIARVSEDIKATNYDGQNVSQGAFLGAALSIIEAVESPMKEHAFVKLATLSLAKSVTVEPSRSTKKVA